MNAENIGLGVFAGSRERLDRAIKRGIALIQTVYVVSGGEELADVDEPDDLGLCGFDFTSIATASGETFPARAVLPRFLNPQVVAKVEVQIGALHLADRDPIRVTGRRGELVLDRSTVREGIIERSRPPAGADLPVTLCVDRGFLAVRSKRRVRRRVRLRSVIGDGPVPEPWIALGPGPQAGTLVALVDLAAA